MSTIEIRVLGPDDAQDLAPLIAENAQALKRGAPRRPDVFYAERILSDRTAEVLGAFEGDELIGFSVFMDLPDLTTGLRIGQIDEIYVHPDHRNKGIGRKMIESLVIEGQSRSWLQLRWLVRDKTAPEIALYDKIAQPDELRSYIIPIAN
ncbi:GNAT family N-acetyltransferase [Roseibium limicola]|uniref:GNAT family N-acetyltransferase n=1 Tax=Roseibium limicola TaxID=2816037 RepID=A0A939ET13_9HYPH|nr:GNAT family N-acetyltransferase [Roseibium limicola]MBO0347088.1 GNAT family N-acetyltransferase [Roseibium limicola]